MLGICGRVAHNWGCRLYAAARDDWRPAGHTRTTRFGFLGDAAIVDMATTSGEPTATPGALIEVRLTAIRYAARDTNLFEFRRLDGKPLPAYEPGAHVDVHLPSGHSRSYSLIVARPDPHTYTFGIKRDPASRGGS